MKTTLIILVVIAVILIFVGMHYVNKGNCTRFKGPFGFSVDVNCID